MLECISGAKQSLVDPDPRECYTLAKKAKCVLCCTEEVQNTSETRHKSTETSDVPKQFSFINIAEHARKQRRNG